MTETHERITDPDLALTLLIGAWGKWVRDSPYCPEDLWGFYERVLGPSGWSPERVLSAIGEADRMIPEDADPQENWSKINQCFEAIGLGALLHNGKTL